MRHFTPVREEIDHYDLLGPNGSRLLPKGHLLTLNKRLGTVAQIYLLQGTIASMVQEQQFSRSELLLFRPLLQAFPFHCPHEVLFTHFTYGEITDESIEQSRTFLQKAEDEGTWTEEMKTLQVTMSRTRLKTKFFKIDLASILKVGYILKSIA